MRILAAIVLVGALGLPGCAQLTGGSSASSSGGPRGPGSEVGKPTKPNASGYLDMPFLTTLSEEEAREVLAESQMTGEIKVEKTECYDKSIPSGHVCNTVPAGGEKTSTTSTTLLFVVP